MAGVCLKISQRLPKNCSLTIRLSFIIIVLLHFDYFLINLNLNFVQDDLRVEWSKSLLLKEVLEPS